MRYFVTFPTGEEVPVDVHLLPTGAIRVTLDGKEVDADCIDLPEGKSPDERHPAGATSVRIGGRVVDLWMEGAPPDVGVVATGRRFYAKVESERMRALAAAIGAARAGSSEGTIKSPMPGRVLKILVKEGDEVEPGSPLIVVEAMKMENELAATRPGTVQKIHVKPGDTVEGGARLIEIA